MSAKNHIQIKAALLFIVFSLNVVVGFACTIGMDMGFNTKHHPEEIATEVHIHDDGSEHHHEKKVIVEHAQKQEADNCCNDEVVKLSQVDKLVPQPSGLISPVFFTAFIAALNNTKVFYPSKENTSNKYFFRGHHPPIPDICIAIQRFQI